MIDLTNKILQKELQSSKDFSNESEMIITMLTLNEDKDEKFIIDSLQLLLMKETARFMLYSECLVIYNQIKEQMNIYAK